MHTSIQFSYCCDFSGRLLRNPVIVWPITILASNSVSKWLQFWPKSRTSGLEAIPSVVHWTTELALTTGLLNRAELKTLGASPNKIDTNWQNSKLWPLPLTATVIVEKSIVASLLADGLNVQTLLFFFGQVLVQYLCMISHEWTANEPMPVPTVPHTWPLQQGRLNVKQTAECTRTQALPTLFSMICRVVVYWFTIIL